MGVVTYKMASSAHNKQEESGTDTFFSCCSSLERRFCACFQDGKDAWPKLRRACEKELSPGNQDYSGSQAAHFPTAQQTSERSWPELAWRSSCSRRSSAEGLWGEWSTIKQILSPSFSVATDSHPHLPPRLLPAPCQSHAIRPHHRCHMQAMTYSPPLLLLLCLRLLPGLHSDPSAIKFSAPKSSRPPFLLPSPPISSLVLPSSPQSLLSSKSPVLLCLILTLVLLLVSAQ